MAEQNRPTVVNAQGGDWAETGRRLLIGIFLGVLGLVLFLHFFGTAKLILLTLLASGCLAAALRPVADHIPAPRWLSSILAGLIPVVLLTGLLALASWLMAARIQFQVQQLPELRIRINEVLDQWGSQLGIEGRITLHQLALELRDFLGMTSGTSVVSTTASAATGVLLAVVLVFFGSVYLLYERQGATFRGMLRLMPPDRRPQLQGALEDLEPRLRWWLIGALVSMTVVGGASAIGYSIVGVRVAIPLALLAGLAELVPTIGPFFAFLVALLFALAHGTTQVIGVIIVYLVIQLLESYVLLPVIMRQAVRIPPVVTLFSVVVWGKVFGAAGLLLALPLDLVIWTLLDHFVIRARDRLPDGMNPRRA